MKLNATEQIRLLLKREIYKQKDLVVELSARTGKKYTQGSLSQKMIRNSISYDEFVIIADILGYDVKIERRDS